MEAGVRPLSKTKRRPETSASSTNWSRDRVAVDGSGVFATDPRLGTREPRRSASWSARLPDREVGAVLFVSRCANAMAETVRQKDRTASRRFFACRLSRERRSHQGPRMFVEWPPHRRPRSERVPRHAAGSRSGSRLACEHYSWRGRSRLCVLEGVRPRLSRPPRAPGRSDALSPANWTVEVRPIWPSRAVRPVGHQCARPTAAQCLNLERAEGIARDSAPRPSRMANFLGRDREIKGSQPDRQVVMPALQAPAQPGLGFVKPACQKCVTRLAQPDPVVPLIGLVQKDFPAVDGDGSVSLCQRSCNTSSGRGHATTPR